MADDEINPRKQAAVDFLQLAISGRIEEACVKYVDMQGRHHNFYFPAGFPALEKAMIANHIQFPPKQLTVRNVLSEGDLVAVHSHIVLEAGGTSMAAVHLFRFDGDKIVELWDIGQSVPPELPNEDGHSRGRTMRKLVFAINVSLDGFADHTVAMADDELHDFFTSWMDTIDAVLFGRATYQLFQSFWPHAPEDTQSTESMIAFAHKINTVPKIVFSNTLRDVDWNNTRLVKKDMVGEVTRLKQEDGGNLSVGGISLIQTFMNLKMVDEYWLLVQPVIWGQGKRLFAGVSDRFDYMLADSKTFRSGVVVLHYSMNQNRARREDHP